MPLTITIPSSMKYYRVFVPADYTIASDVTSSYSTTLVDFKIHVDDTRPYIVLVKQNMTIYVSNTANISGATGTVSYTINQDGTDVKTYSRNAVGSVSESRNVTEEFYMNINGQDTEIKITASVSESGDGSATGKLIGGSWIEFYVIPLENYVQIT